MKIVFPEKSIEAIYKRSKNLKEILSSVCIIFNDKKSNC